MTPYEITQLSRKKYISESTQLTSYDKGIFLFHYHHATPMTNWAQIFTRLLFYAHVETTEVRRLVFDNYQ